jgi:hypothetical protein
MPPSATGGVSGLYVDGGGKAGLQTGVASEVYE